VKSPQGVKDDTANSFEHSKTGIYLLDFTHGQKTLSVDIKWITHDQAGETTTCGKHREFCPHDVTCGWKGGEGGTEWV